ncbi:MAG: hypothetical protein ACI87N_000016 [Flavobacteriales bacterium]|jgi:hypothetical protein
MIDESVSRKSVRHIYLFFVIAAVLSFLYAIVKNRLNGDFLGVEVTLPFWLLLLNLIFSILPFFFTWRVYLYFSRRTVKRKITIPITFFGYFLVAIIIWNVIVTIIFGVGVMGAPPYEAPSYIKPIIQIMNRFNAYYGVFLYFLVVPKKNKTQFILVIMALVLAYLRAGLGLFLYLAMFGYLKYFIEISSFVKKQKVVVITLLCLFPILFSGLYELRNTLRNQESKEAITDPIFGVLVGRLSSFSDSAFILQEAPSFLLGAKNLDPFYFQKQALGGVISQDFMPEIRPEIMLFKFYYENSEDNVAYMAGTQGNLYLSLFHSGTTFFLNLTTIILFIYITFYVFRLLRFNYSNEMAFILLLYVLMSGVSNEYAFLIFSIFIYLFLFLIINLLGNLKKQ